MLSMLQDITPAQIARRRRFVLLTLLTFAALC